MVLPPLLAQLQHSSPTPGETNYVHLLYEDQVAGSSDSFVPFYQTTRLRFPAGRIFILTVVRTSDLTQQCECDAPTPLISGCHISVLRTPIVSAYSRFRTSTWRSVFHFADISITQATLCLAY